MGIKLSTLSCEMHHTETGEFPIFMYPKATVEDIVELAQLGLKFVGFADLDNTAMFVRGENGDGNAG